MKNIIKHNKKLIVFFLAICFLSACNIKGNKTTKTNGEKHPPIMVFAAASLTDVITEITSSFETKYHLKVKTNMASSGTLARQIEQGGAPDVYISASKKWANYIDSLGFVSDSLKQNIATNELVLIAPKDSPQEKLVINKAMNIVSLLGTDRLSMGDPSHVPAGKYAKQSLEFYGWYQKLKSRCLPAKDVRSALMMVEMGETPVGIVYRTDAKKSAKVKILGTFPENSHKPIVYVALVCKNNRGAKDFYAYLNSEETNAIWSKYGFKK